MVFLIERVGGQSVREETGIENGKPCVLVSVPKEPREVRRAWMVCGSHYREAPIFDSMLRQWVVAHGWGVLCPLKVRPLVGARSNPRHTSPVSLGPSLGCGAVSLCWPCLFEALLSLLGG